MVQTEINQTLQLLAEQLKRGGCRVVTAESCTAGWIAKSLTDPAGSSAWFERGFVTYSNASKEEMLGVERQTLIEHGAVSEAVIQEMVSGALEKSCADLAVAVSGIAGPSGGTAEKPVGLVWFGWQRRGGELQAESRLFEGDREAVRAQTVVVALQGLSRLVVSWMSNRRLFFALEPPATVRAEIEQIKQNCAAENRGRAVTEGNLHLTLQFIGAVAEGEVAGLITAAECLSAAPFELSLDCFGHWERPRALWLGPQITPVPLLALQRGLESVLQQQCGIEPEVRTYRPHVTLMRKVKQVEFLPQIEPLNWSVEQFSLMESVSTGQGVVYRALQRWELG